MRSHRPFQARGDALPFARLVVRDVGGDVVGVSGTPPSQRATPDARIDLGLQGRPLVALVATILAAAW